MVARALDQDRPSDDEYCLLTNAIQTNVWVNPLSPLQPPTTAKLSDSSLVNDIRYRTISDSR